MRSPLLLTSLLALAGLSQAQTPHADTLAWSVDAGVATDLVYRGLDLSDDSWVPSLRAAVEHRSGFYLRSWLTRVELAGLSTIPEGSQWQGLIDAGYNWRPGRDWSLSVGRSWYRYSADLRGHSPDYTEWTATLHYSAYLSLSVAHSENLWGLDVQQDVASLSARRPLGRRVIGEATVGWVSQSLWENSDYQFVSLNVGYVRGDWSMQLQFHSTFGSIPAYNPARTGNQWVAQLTRHW